MGESEALSLGGARFLVRMNLLMLVNNPMGLLNVCALNNVSQLRKVTCRVWSMTEIEKALRKSIVARESTPHIQQR